MDKISIIGGNPLKGSLKISGAKNAALPLLAAGLLTKDPVILTNLPELSDITTFLDLMAHMGCDCIREPGQVTLRTPDVLDLEAPYELVRKMRASVLVLGPVLSRFKEVRLSLPGGCAIGTRPVDLHLKGLEKMGAEIILSEGYVTAKAPKGLKGCDYTFPIVSVTGTENLLMAACLAHGTTRLLNAAQEPEVTDLAHCLVGMGAKISGIGTSTLVIEGQAELGGTTHSILPDRIETGTYAIAAAITGGSITLENTSLKLLPLVTQTLCQVGLGLEQKGDNVEVNSPAHGLKPQDIITEPFPGFPTDLQAQFMALMTTINGASSITETIFENRFMHVPELARMGADIAVKGNTALVRGVSSLKGAPVMATDLRASVSLVLAGLAAEGETLVSRVYHLDRGYEKIEEKLSACGAHIKRIRKDPVIDEPSINTTSSLKIASSGHA
tara:strand:- start:2375 stop:3703 length:1329 start_codon:yes stop_codon:yes gene_type:complete